MYVHNDTLLALNRIPDSFGDGALASTPLLSRLSLSSKAIAGLLVYNIKLSTSDFLVTHIHSFTIHTTVLILLKGALVNRSSRLVPDKVTLGFRYPCDGPGRGGTCQISAWDHTFLGLFWMYNSISIVVFHLFWEIKSSLASNIQSTGYLSDFFTNGTCVNGWLGLLWSTFCFIQSDMYQYEITTELHTLSMLTRMYVNSYTCEVQSLSGDPARTH